MLEPLTSKQVVFVTTVAPRMFCVLVSPHLIPPGATTTVAVGEGETADDGTVVGYGLIGATGGATGGGLGECDRGEGTG